MNERPILYVDDDKENLSTLRRVLRGEYNVEVANHAEEGLALLEKGTFPVLLTDQRMPGTSGVEFLQAAQEKSPDSIGIVITAYSDFEPVVDGINSGVIYRYLHKPWKETELRQAITQAFEKYDLVTENRRLLSELQRANTYFREEIDEQYDFSALAGADQGLKKVTELVGKVAPTTSTVLIRGESGVGKELVARSLHAASPRKKKPFVRVNCGSLAEGLLESELFGHEKGAFTGAENKRIGRFEAAEGGTIFLDEVGDLSGKLQVSLLRVLQEREFERVGGNQTISVDVRVIAATHQNLERLCSEKTFREDLFYRLNVFPIVVPPLRERIGDLSALSQRLLKQASRRTGSKPKSLSKEALAHLKKYDWPGNVRELENILERASILSTGNQIESEDLILGSDLSSSNPLAEASELSREAIEEALATCSGNKVQAARHLGIKRPTLYYHLKRFNIN